MTIYCTGCGKDVEARPTTGAEIYTRRSLADVPFWKCDSCGNYVGCHRKSSDPTRPLGVIPTQELRLARSEIHKILDPIWKNGLVPRNVLYKKISERLGIKRYHTAELRTIEDARMAYRVIREIGREAGAY